ncbi:MAG: integrase arm-type DNA-binding domain-containing protein [Candidatus Ozemobacteraceae bacterium]
MLSDTSIRTAKPKASQYKKYDSRGLFVLITPTGKKLWRLRYSFAGKERLLSFGEYPIVSLKLARERRDDALTLLAQDVDPSTHKRAVKQARIEQDANSFEVIAREWHERTVEPVKAPAHSIRIMQRLEKNVFPWIGKRPVSEIQPADVLSVLHRMEKRGVIDTAHRALGNIGQVFRYAVRTGRIPSDPTRDLRGALTPVIHEHLAAIVDPKSFGALLRGIDEYRGTPVVRAALQLAPLLAVRPGELRHAEWKDIDLEVCEWRFLVTKTKVQHIVPLARQAAETLRDLYELTGDGRYVFPNPRSPNGSRPMSENAVLVALRAMGIPKSEASGHGFRATFRTIGAEVLKFRPDLLEQQLAHNVRDPLGRAYNRTTFIEERRAMMQTWADYLDRLRNLNQISGTLP